MEIDYIDGKSIGIDFIDVKPMEVKFCQWMLKPVTCISCGNYWVFWSVQIWSSITSNNVTFLIGTKSKISEKDDVFSSCFLCRPFYLYKLIFVV